MVNIVPPEREDELREYIQMKIELPATKGATTVIGFLDDEYKILGGWMFERYTGVTGSVHAHWAGEPGWLTRGALSIVAAYVFGQMRVTRVFGEVKRSDKYVRELDERLGFEKVAILPGYFPGDDLVVYSMTKEQCRWLPKAVMEMENG